MARTIMTYARSRGGEFKPRIRIFNRNTVLGTIIFGIGWSISGQCPGSALSRLGIGNFPVILGIAAMFIGSYVIGKFLG